MTHKDYVCAPPPIETLSEKCAGHHFWPQHLAIHPRFKKQVLAQRELLSQLRLIFDRLPLGQTLADGFSQGVVTEQEVERLSILLTEQLERGDVQKRLALYLPFELLSPITFGSADVQWASAHLHRAYRDAWERLLCEHEVRANYVDGDVLEPELLVGDHPRVVKAAHLIPGLLTVGHFTPQEVYGYLQIAKEHLLERSIREACIVATDLGLLTPSIDLSNPHHPRSGPVPTTRLTEGRARWLAKLKQEETLREQSEALATALKGGVHVAELGKGVDLLVAVEAVRIAALQNESVFPLHRAWLDSLTTTNHEPATHDCLTALYAHMHARSLVSSADLRALGIFTPSLGGPFYENRNRLQPPAVHIVALCEQLATHPVLSKLVYPVALVFGSQVKGYGRTEADCDIAVFVRPGVHREKREQLEKQLRQIFNHERFDNDIKLFWLTDTPAGLRVIDWPGHVHSDAQSGWVYVLFGALWCGEYESMKLLHERLLATYFTPPHTLTDGKPTRERWLEEMERDSLQYRLLHKGFARYYPISSPMNTLHGDGIDGASAFYDPRYRRIATELFIRRVFLPNLSA
jgi:hypothetical protein